MESRKIIVTGLGGVGGYFGFKIAQQFEHSKDVQVTFVARNETFKVVQEKGLTLLSAEHVNPVAKPYQVIENIAQAGNADLVLICVKEYDLEQVCIRLRENITSNTVLLPLMNGVDIYDRIRKIITNGIVLPSCVYVAAHIKEKGVVEHKGNPGKIIMGKDPQHINYAASWVFDLLKDCGIDIVYKEDSFPDIWTKFFFIASFGLVSARYNKSIGQVNEDALLKSRATSIMQEIHQITSAKSIDIPGDIIELTFQKAATFPYHTPTSLQLDVQSKKAHNELDLFAGAIIKYGNELHIKVAETESIRNEIMQMQ